MTYPSPLSFDELYIIELDELGYSPARIGREMQMSARQVKDVLIRTAAHTKAASLAEGHGA